MKSITLSKIFLGISALTFLSCSAQNMGPFGQILASTGLVSGSQADAILQAGAHVAKGVKSLNEEEEYYLGRGVSATILSKYKPYRNSELTAYVNKVCNVVAAVSDRPETFGGYHVMLLDTPEINAVSAPGGFVFISTGFLKIVPSEDALAAVLAHEVGHVVKGHGLKAISEANFTQALTLLGKEAAASQGGAVVQQLTSTFGDSITDIANTILSKGYSRSQEYEADAYAAELLQRSGYTTGGLGEMLSSLEKAAGSSASGGWTSTHPKPEDRREELSSLITPANGDVSEAIRTRRFQAAKGRLG